MALSKLKKVDLREEWQHEATDFSFQWLLETAQEFQSVFADQMKKLKI